MSKKNVLLLLPSFSEPGGAQKAVSALGELLAEKYNVLECAFDGDRQSRVFKNSNPAFSLGVGRPRNLFERLTGYVRKAARLNRVKRRHAIDITISNLWPADLVNVLSGGPGKRVSVAHINIAGNPDNRLLLEHRWVARTVYGMFDRVVAVSSRLEREIADLFRLSGRTQTIVNFVLPSADVSRAAEPSPGRLHLLWCGRLEPIKNLRPLLPIFSRVKGRLPSAQLVVLGVGSQRDDLVREAQAIGLRVSVGDLDSDADVVFAGFHPNPVVVMRESDLLLLTSLAEGLPLVMLEALAAGLPTLAADCPSGGPQEILARRSDHSTPRVESEETPCGFLLPVPTHGDERAARVWEECIVSALENRSLRERQRENCRRRASDYSAERVRDQWCALLDDLCRAS